MRITCTVGLAVAVGNEPAFGLAIPGLIPITFDVEADTWVQAAARADKTLVVAIARAQQKVLRRTGQVVTFRQEARSLLQAH